MISRAPLRRGVLAGREAPVAAPILGVRTPAQLQENLGALDVELTRDHLGRLDDASAIALGFPHELLVPKLRSRLFGEVDIDQESR